MRIRQSEFVRGAATGLFCAIGIALVLIPVLVWGRERAPEFFGAFVAAIVAAIAVVLGAFYQASLTRQRDDEIRKQEQHANAVDLVCWLDHAVSEMEFIADLLAKMSEHLEREGKTNLDWTANRYRAVVTAEFMNEIYARAKSAARLPSPVAEAVSRSLYQSFMRVERLHWQRGIPDTFVADIAHITKHEKLVRTEADRLREAQELLSLYVGGREKQANPD
jgi:hypothetical protein